ncbi:hypothetical protein D3C71_1472200 [compost metagenome]
MRNIVYGRYSVLDIMRCPVAREAHAYHAVQRHGSTVQNRLPQLVILQIVNQLRAGFHHGDQERFAEAVLNRRIDIVVEIMLQHMGHHVHDAVHRLVARHRERMLRIEDGEDRIRMRAAPAHLLFGLLIRDHRAVVHLGAGSRHCQNRAERQRILGNRLALHEIPHIAIILRANGDSLAAVEHAAAAYCQNQIYILAPAEIDPFMYGRQAGVRLNTW